MSKLFNETTQALYEARAYMEGERQGCKVTPPTSIDVHIIPKTSTPTGVILSEAKDLLSSRNAAPRPTPHHCHPERSEGPASPFSNPL